MNIQTLILVVIHTCLADLLLKAFKRLFQLITYLEELVFFWCASINQHGFTSLAKGCP